LSCPLSQIETALNYFAGDNLLTCFVRVDFLLATVFLCILPLEAVLSKKETASTKSVWALTGSFSSTTFLVSVFTFDKAALFLSALFLVERTLFLADLCCAINKNLILLKNVGKYSIRRVTNQTLFDINFIIKTFVLIFAPLLTGKAAFYVKDQ